MPPSPAPGSIPGVTGDAAGKAGISVQIKLRHRLSTMPFAFAPATCCLRDLHDQSLPRFLR